MVSVVSEGRPFGVGGSYCINFSKTRRKLCGLPQNRTTNDTFTFGFIGPVNEQQLSLWVKRVDRLGGGGSSYGLRNNHVTQLSVKDMSIPGSQLKELT